MKKSVSSFKKVICMVLVALTLVGSTVVPGTQFFSTTAKADYDCIEYYPPLYRLVQQSRGRIKNRWGLIPALVIAHKLQR